MIYDEDSINKKFDEIAAVIGGLPPVVHAMPSYMNNPNWTDDNREKAGYTKQEDGSWVQFVSVDVLVEHLKRDVLDLHRRNSDNYNKLALSQRKNHEMEYGLRVAQKSLMKALDMKVDDGL